MSDPETTAPIPAHFGRRVLAGLIDLAVMAATVPIATFLTVLLVGWFYELTPGLATDVEPRNLFLSLLPVVVAVVLGSYEPAFVARAGRTPGKAATHLWVVRDDGRELTLGVAVARGLLKILSMLPLGLGFWTAAVDSRKKAWHDVFLHTTVTRQEPVVQEDERREVPPEFARRAHPLRRLGARIIDGFLILVGAGFVLEIAKQVAAASTDPATGGITPIAGALAVLLYAGYLCAVAFYEIGMIATQGQTLGKMAAGVRITDLKGETPGWWASTTRWLVTTGVALIPVVGLFIAGFVVLWVIWDRDGRGLHDRIAGTYAVVEEPGIRIVSSQSAQEG